MHNNLINRNNQEIQKQKTKYQMELDLICPEKKSLEDKIFFLKGPT